MRRTESWLQITKTGEAITQRWRDLAKQHDLKITTGGLPSLTNFTFESPNALAYKTLITQEMLSRGFLASNSVYVCTEHTQDVVDHYFTLLDPIFQKIRQCEDGKDVMSLLHGPVCDSGFKRLN